MHPLLNLLLNGVFEPCNIVSKYIIIALKAKELPKGGIESTARVKMYILPEKMEC
jgi:hypothetical protein